MTQTRVVIIGGGFGGLSVAKRLLRSNFGRKNLAITIVDQHTESTYTPWLHEIAGGSAARVACNDSNIDLEAVRGLRYRKGIVVNIDDIERHVLLTDGSSIAYDILVCAMGSIPNNFSIPGVLGFAFDLKRTGDALAIRERFAKLVIEAKKSKKSHRIVVVGTGSNGTAFAAECATTIRYLVHCGELKPNSIAIDLIGNTNDPLIMLTPFLRQLAVNRLRKIGITLMNNTALMAVQINGVTIRSLKEGIPMGDSYLLPCDLCAVALGVKMSDVVDATPFAKTQRGRIRVNDEMIVVRQTAVFALGDCASIDGRPPEPHTAQVAVAQSVVVARNILNLIQQKPLTKFAEQPSWDIIVTFGTGYALGSIGGIPVWGYTIAILRRFIDARYFFLVLPFWKAVEILIRGFLTYGKAKLGEENKDLDKNGHR